MCRLLSCLSRDAGTAAAGSDYTAVSDTLTFATNSTEGDTQCIVIPISSDGILEGDETFSVLLSISTADVVEGNAITTITIMDDG